MLSPQALYDLFTAAATKNNLNIKDVLKRAGIQPADPATKATMAPRNFFYTKLFVNISVLGRRIQEYICYLINSFIF